MYAADQFGLLFSELRHAGVPRESRRCASRKFATRICADLANAYSMLPITLSG